LYVSTETDIYKSTDSAVTWNPINKGLRAMPIFELSVDPRNPDTLYGSERRGIIKSTDGGASWKRLLDTVNTRADYIDPKDSNTLYAAAGWTLDSKRVLKSVDGGGTWTSASKGFPDSTCPLVSALSIDPENTGTLYASLWPGGGGGCRDEAGGAPDHHSGGLWKTTDSGISWAKVASPPLGGGFESLAIQPQNSHVLYASNSKGLYRSTDAGMIWEVLSNKPRTEFSALLIDPLTPSTLYITSEDSGVLKSIDAGLNWQAVNSGLPSQYFNQKDNYRITSLVLDARNPNTLFANADGFGVYRSSDGGASWQAMNAGLTTFSIWRLAIDPTGPKLYAATDGGVFTITF
jgi:photosystem II stability/assembly factor-like uncharacterized protein